MMGHIYRRATRALIWLGDASETVDRETGLSVSALFLDYLPRMAAEIRQSRSKGESIPTSPLWDALSCQASEYVKSGRLTPLAKGFLDVALRPWWERVWVVQEAALAESAIVICGDRTAHYSDFYVLFYQNYVDTRPESGQTYFLLDGFKHQMYSVMIIKEQMQELDPPKALHRVLSKSRRLRATDKRDHIFAMLDFFDEVKCKLPLPDYSKSVSEIFTGATGSFLRLSESLHILLEATNVESDLNFPSWVTDWSQRPQFHIPSQYYLYHASGISKSCYNILNGGKELKLLGKFVDVIEELPKADVAAYNNPYIPARAIFGYQQSCRVGLSIKQYPTGENVQEVLWRTLCWNLDVNFRYPANRELAIPFEKFHQALFSGKDIEVIEKELLLEEAVGFNDICVHSMPLSLTSNGYLASVPWTAKVGDRVALFAGGELPFILRTDPTGGHYRLMGACYVHGMMNGEAFPPDPSDLEWISIR